MVILNVLFLKGVGVVLDCYIQYLNAILPRRGLAYNVPFLGMIGTNF